MIITLPIEILSWGVKVTPSMVLVLAEGKGIWSLFQMNSSSFHCASSAEAQVGLTVCMAVLSGRVCPKICFHMCFLGRYFLWVGLRDSSFNRWSNACNGTETCEKDVTAAYSPLYNLLPESVSHFHLSRRNPACLGGLHTGSISSVEVYPFLSVCANDTGGINRKQSLNSWDGNKSTYRSLNEAADVSADAWCSGFVYSHGATEMEESKAIMAGYPVCRFSISVFPGSLPSPACISLPIIQTADFLKMVPIWFQPPPALLFRCIWRGALPSAST